MPFMSNYVLNNRGNFNLQLLRRFKNIAVFCSVIFLLPQSLRLIYFAASNYNRTFLCPSAKAWVCT